jgi:hypothetical protein
LTIPDTTSGIFVVYLHYMRKLLTFVLLLIGLVGYTQTNSHQQITGHIYTRGINFIPSNNDIQLLVYSVDTLGFTTVVNPSNYTSAMQSNQYVITFSVVPTTPIVVYAKLLPGSRLQNKFLSTFGTSSLSIHHATRVVVPNILGAVNVVTYDIYMVPDISWRVNSRHTD